MISLFDHNNYDANHNHLQKDHKTSQGNQFVFDLKSIRSISKFKNSCQQTLVKTHSAFAGSLLKSKDLIKNCCKHKKHHSEVITSIACKRKQSKQLSIKQTMSTIDTTLYNQDPNDQYPSIKLHQLPTTTSFEDNTQQIYTEQSLKTECTNKSNEIVKTQIDLTMELNSQQMIKNKIQKCHQNNTGIDQSKNSSEIGTIGINYSNKAEQQQEESQMAPIFQEEQHTQTAFLADECKMIIYTSQKTPTINKIPLSGPYYKSRTKFLLWVANYCRKFKLSRQTFASSALLLDDYFAVQKYVPDQFVRVALSAIIIGSRINEKKVLSSKVIAEYEKYPLDKINQAQYELVKWFGFKVNRYNVARQITTYIRQWDKTMQILSSAHSFEQLPFTLLPTQQSYVLNRKIFFLADRQFIHNKCLTSRQIKQIFRAVLEPHLQSKFNLNKIFQRVFSVQTIGELNQYSLTYEFICESDANYQNYQEKVVADLIKWQSQYPQAEWIGKFNQWKTTTEEYAVFVNYQQ